MVLKRGDITSELKKKSQVEKDSYLRETLGLTPGELAGLQTGSVYSRLERAVELVYHGGHENGSRKNLSHITTSLLAYLAGVTEPDVSHTLRERYQDRRMEFKSAYKLDPPYIELLRHDVSGERIPFIEERKVWQGFKPSVDDWRRDVTLPLPPFDRETSHVIGVMWGDGYTNTRNKHSRLIGNGEDVGLYNIIVPRMSELYEYKSSIGGKSVSVSTPLVFIDSKAVYTWLVNDLGFPVGERGKWGKRGVKLPTTYCHGKGLLEGLNASMGNVMSDKKRGNRMFTISDRDRDFVDGIRGLAVETGYRPTAVFSVGSKEFEGSWRFAYSINDTARLVFINPRHRLPTLQRQPAAAL